MNLTIPFHYLNRQGEIEVVYERNDSAVQSGMDVFENMGFDVNVCLGYPTIHAKIKSYEGTGYRMTAGWIQIVEYRIYSLYEDCEPSKIVRQIDNYPIMREKMPFCAFGALPQLYDAPSNAIVEGERVEFIADTFFVSLPAPFNNDTISSLASFTWGYVEDNRESNRKITMKPVVLTDAAMWKKCCEILRKEYPTYQFS